MKTKLFKSCLSLMLALLMCVSLITPAVSALDDEPAEETVAKLPVHASEMQVTKSDLAGLFADSYSYYGISAKDDSENITQLSNNSFSVAEGEEYTAYATNAKSNRKPDWSNPEKQNFTPRLYYTASFSVSGTLNGALYLNDAAAEGTVRLFADEAYTVTAQAVDNFTCEVTGVTAGEEFTPQADLTITAAYTPILRAEVSLTVGEGGSAKITAAGITVADLIPEGETFEVVATPNSKRGYELDSIVVTKNGEEIAPNEGVYGPVADGESYAVSVSFNYNPITFDLDVDANSSSVNRSTVKKLLGNYSNYGIAPQSDPNNVTQLYSLLGIENSYNVVDGGVYYIYGAADKNWQNAQLAILTVRTYYNGTFSASGHDDAAVYLNGEQINGKVKLYTDSEYTVTAASIDDYFYTMEGAEDGVTFTPTANVNVSVVYMKLAYATYTVNAGKGGAVKVMVNGSEADGRIGEGNTFTVEAVPNANRGYEFESLVVTKDGEVLEPEEGVYGPVLDGESYEITATFTFNPPRRDMAVNANSMSVSRSNVKNILGDYSNYGIAPESDPENITKLYSLLGLENDYDVVDGGVYYIYGSSNNSWDNAKLIVVTVKAYYVGTFTVTGNEEGEIYLNEEPVNGNVRLYTNTEYTVTVKDIVDYTYTLNGVEEGVSFIPGQNMEITAAYVKERYATVNVNANNGGSVEVLVNDEPAFEKISEDESFEVVVNADSNHRYYIESIVVTKDGEEVEATDGLYGPVADGESYEVNVTFARVSFDLDDCEVDLVDIKNNRFDAVKEQILSNTTLDPEDFGDDAVMSVSYAAYSLLGYDVYEPLNYTGSLSHNFGTETRGGRLMGGNTEKVRVVCELPDLGIKMTEYATVTVYDPRLPAAISGSSITVSYDDDLKAAVMNVISVTDEDGNPIVVTEDQISLDPNKLNADPSKAQDLTVIYDGSDEYQACECVISVTVKKGKSSLKVVSETIYYGETPALEVITTPEDLDYLTLIAGIDGDAKDFISFIIPNNLKEKMQFKVAGIVIFDMYDYIAGKVGDGVTIQEFRNIITDLIETVTGNDTIREVIEAVGFDVETLDTILTILNKLPESKSNLLIRLDKIPVNAGIYMVYAVSADRNYRTSMDSAYLIIRRKSGGDESVVELRFKTESEEDLLMLTEEEAAEFEFGADLYADDKLVETNNIRTEYSGTSIYGRSITQDEPIIVPGTYTETAYLRGGNYTASSISRTYTVGIEKVELMMDDMTVDYDGEAHSPVVYTDETVDLTGRITYLYTGDGYYSRKAPVNAGEYKVTATYSGDATHLSASVTADLIINKLDAVVTVTCKDEITYGDATLFDLTAAEIRYSVSGTVNNDSLGIILPAMVSDDNYPNVGEYTATVLILLANSNYNISIENAAFAIVPRKVVLTIDDVEKQEGEEDPAFTFALTDTDGRPLNENEVGVELAREEGEAVGAYEIYVKSISNANYELDKDATVNGTLTINERPLPEPYILGDVDGDGEVSIFDVTALQRHLANIDVPGYNEQAADADEDGTVSVFDATEIQRWLAKVDANENIGKLFGGAANA